MATMESLQHYFHVHPRATRHYTPTGECPHSPYWLEDVYTSHSHAKDSAFCFWRNAYHDLGGYDWCITSATSQFFTVQFVVKLDTGDAYLCIATGRTAQAWRIA